MSPEQIEAGTYLFTRASLLLGILAIGVMISFSQARKIEGKKFVWWPLLIAAALVAFQIPGLLADPFGGGSSPEEVQRAESVIHVRVSESDLPQGGPSSFDPSKVTMLKSGLHDAVKHALEQTDVPTDSLSTEAVILGEGPNQVLAASARLHQQIVESHVLGMKGAKLIEIVCVPDDALRPSFRISDGACGAKIKEVLGSASFTLLEGH